MSKNTDSTRRRFLGATAGAIGAVTTSAGALIVSGSGERTGSRSPIAPQQAGTAGTTGRVLITFDHAAPSVYGTAFPILREFGYPALLAVVADRIGPTQDSLLGLPQLEELQSVGWEIGSHSMSTHPDLMSLSNAEIRSQCREAKQWLLDQGFATEAAAIAYPYASANERVADVAREYFAIGFGGPYRHGTAITDPLLVGRVNGDDVEATGEAIDAAAANGQVLAIMYHTVGADNDRVTAAAFRETMARIESKGEELQVITPSTLDRLLAGEGTESSAGRTANGTQATTETDAPAASSTNTAETSTTTRTGTSGTPADSPATTIGSPAGRTDASSRTETGTATDSPSPTTDTPSATPTTTPTDSPPASAADSTAESDPTDTDTRTAVDGPGFGVLAALSGLAGWGAYRLRTNDE